jgi:phospholipase A1/A2
MRWLVMTGLLLGLAAEEADPPILADPVAALPSVQSYEPIYLLFGGDPAIAKFQVSLKTRLFNPTWGTPKEGHVGDGFYFGYSQTTFWDIVNESRPFVDSSYRPELFWLKDDLHPTWLADRAEFWWQAGVKHESNGQGDPGSRSFNVMYVRPSITVRWSKRRFLTIKPTVWNYIGDSSDNPDIAKYRGYGDLQIIGGKDDGLQVSFLGRIGAGFDRGYAQFDLTFPLSRVGTGYFRPFLHLQASSGYAESLAAYRDSEQRFLLGMSFVR